MSQSGAIKLDKKLFGHKCIACLIVSAWMLPHSHNMRTKFLNSVGNLSSWFLILISNLDAELNEILNHLKCWHSNFVLFFFLDRIRPRAHEQNAHLLDFMNTATGGLFIRMLGFKIWHFLFFTPVHCTSTKSARLFLMKV